MRNLGGETLEILIESGDDVMSIVSQVDLLRARYKAEYLVVKVNTKFHKISETFQKAGFLLIENQISLRLPRIEALEKKNFYKKIYQDVTFQLIENEQDVENIKHKIKEGIFTTDRIAIDSYYGIEIANTRYANWVQDEVDKGSLLYFVIYQNKKIGFFLSKPINNKLQYGLLGGFFLQYSDAALGSMMDYCMICEFITSERKFMETAVSSNNLVILQLHLLFGYKIKAMTNILIKHYKRG